MKITFNQWACMTGRIPQAVILADLPTNEYNQLMRDYQADELSHMSKDDYLYNLIGNALETGEFNLLASVANDDFEEMVNFIEAKKIKYGFNMNDTCSKVVAYAEQRYNSKSLLDGGNVLVLSVQEMKDRVESYTRTFKDAIKCIELMQYVETEQYALWVELKNGHAFTQRLEVYTNDDDSWDIAQALYTKISNSLD